MTSREQQAEQLSQLAAAFNGLAPNLIAALAAGAEALRSSPVQERVIEQERETDHNAALTAGDAERALVPAWLPIEEPIPKGTVLVTNNINARDALGGMSHVWRGDIIKANEPEKTGPYVTFTDDDRLVQGLSHYCRIPMPLPSPPEAK